eukprot:tig00000852_g5016.t1
MRAGETPRGGDGPGQREAAARAATPGAQSALRGSRKDRRPEMGAGGSSLGGPTGPGPGPLREGRRALRRGAPLHGRPPPPVQLGRIHASAAAHAGSRLGRRERGGAAGDLRGRATVRGAGRAGRAAAGLAGGEGAVEELGGGARASRVEPSVKAASASARRPSTALDAETCAAVGGAGGAGRGGAGRAWGSAAPTGTQRATSTAATAAAGGQDCSTSACSCATRKAR